METIRWIYYYFWSRVLRIDILTRSIIVTGIIFLALPMILKSIIKIIKISITILQLFFSSIVFATIIANFPSLSQKTQMMCNNTTAVFDKISNIEYKKIINKWILFCYFVIILIIALPSFISQHVSNEYLGILGVGSRLYISFEELLTKDIFKYLPMISINNDIEKVGEDVKEVWLTLSIKGKNGSNIREKPGIEGKIVKVIKGDEKFLYLGEIEVIKEQRWVYISTNDGTIGWISEVLIEGLP